VRRGWRSCQADVSTGTGNTGGDGTVASPAAIGEVEAREIVRTWPCSNQRWNSQSERATGAYVVREEGVGGFNRRRAGPPRSAEALRLRGADPKKRATSKTGAGMITERSRRPTHVWTWPRDMRDARREKMVPSRRVLDCPPRGTMAATAVDHFTSTKLQPGVVVYVPTAQGLSCPTVGATLCVRSSLTPG